MTRLLAILGPVVIAAEQGIDSFGLERLLNYGVLGVFTVLLAVGRLEGPKRADRAEARAEAEAKARSELEAVYRTDVVPALTRFTDIASRILNRETK